MINAVERVESAVVAVVEVYWGHGNARKPSWDVVVVENTLHVPHSILLLHCSLDIYSILQKSASLILGSVEYDRSSTSISGKIRKMLKVIINFESLKKTNHSLNILILAIHSLNP